MSLIRTASPVERWGVYEVRLPGPQHGNPFVDVSFGARFCHRHRVVSVDGFYDGSGDYCVRYSPDAIGEWTYVTCSNRAELDSNTGSLACVAPSAASHGPVRVHSTYHWAYADGRPYRQIGTTCYAWVHQGDALEEQTLQTLRSAPFNKLRMCVFPKFHSLLQRRPLAPRQHPIPRLTVPIPQGVPCRKRPNLHPPRLQ